MSDATIEMIRAREVLDSRGDPTVGVDVFLAGGAEAILVLPIDLPFVTAETVGAVVEQLAQPEPHGFGRLNAGGTI